MMGGWGVLAGITSLLEMTYVMDMSEKIWVSVTRHNKFLWRPFTGMLDQNAYTGIKENQQKDVSWDQNKKEKKGGPSLVV